MLGDGTAWLSPDRAETPAGSGHVSLTCPDGQSGGLFVVSVETVWASCPDMVPCGLPYAFFFSTWSHFLPHEQQTHLRIFPL